MAMGKLTAILVVLLLGAMAYMTMFGFYFNIVNEYQPILNFTVDESFNATYLLMNETLNTGGRDMTATGQGYLNESAGTQTTASDTTIIRSFGVVKTFLVNSFALITKVIPDTAERLKIPKYWYNGFVAIIITIIIITIVAGFFKITTW